VLRTVRDHLTKDGRFAFESRNPARRAWLSWTPDKRKLATTDGHGRIEEFFDTVADAQTGIVNIVHLRPLLLPLAFHFDGYPLDFFTPWPAEVA